MDKKQSHLEMIQGIINRLSQNSFLLKGWNVVLISALFALAANKSNIFFVYLAYFPSISFWVLDGYFLWQEKLFRELFEYVRQLNEDEIDFSMDITIIKDNVKTWDDVIFTKTLIIFHGTVFLSILIVMLLVLFTK